MSVRSVSSDGDGFAQLQLLREQRAGQAAPAGVARSATGIALGGSIGRPLPASTSAFGPPHGTTGAAGLGGTPSGWLGAAEKAAVTLIADLLAFVAGLQAGGSADRTGNTGSHDAPPAGTGTANATATDATAGNAPATSATSANAPPPATPSANPAPADTASASASTGLDVATAATTSPADTVTNLVAALHSFLGILQGGGANHPGSVGAPGPSPWDGAGNRHVGSRHHHHFHDDGGNREGGWGRGFGGQQTTNQLLGDILGVLESYSAQGGQWASPPAASSLSA